MPLRNNKIYDTLSHANLNTPVFIELNDKLYPISRVRIQQKNDDPKQQRVIITATRRSPKQKPSHTEELVYDSEPLTCDAPSCWCKQL